MSRMSKTSWKSIQSKLARLKYDPGPIDGICGAKTITALKAFQKAFRLDIDGRFGPNTRSALFPSAGKIDTMVMTCAQMAAISYKLDKNKWTEVDTELEDDFKLKVTHRCPAPDVEAYMLSNNCLLIPGSNSAADYFKFNFVVNKTAEKTRTLILTPKGRVVFSKETKAGASGTIWHQGFLEHAETIYNWIIKNKLEWPSLIIGHSLGAASAQILSKTFATPAIGFAAPRLRKAKGRITLDHLSLSICRNDDGVCKLPRRFHHIGQTKALVHNNPKGGMNHNMAAYIDALKNQKPGLNIPTVWDP